MVFGHNSTVSMGTAKFHVQTEDRGESHALIDTTVYYNGRVLHRRTNSYFDLLPLNPDHEQALKLRVDDQHYTVVEDIRSGKLQLGLPSEAEKTTETHPVASQPSVEQPAASESTKLVVELINAKSWISGKNAVLQVRVRREDGTPIAGIQVDAHIEGSEDPQVRSAETGLLGAVQIQFAMPRITGTEAALVIHAENQEGQGHLRFALRAKARVPSV